MILSHMDGREMNECVQSAATDLNVPPKLIESFISQILDAADTSYIKSGDMVSAFPPRTLISIDSMGKYKLYEPELFAYETIDLSMKRHLTPSTITLMVNNICATNCIYCYEDKSKIVNCTIPLNRIFEIIREAHNLHVNTFDVVGGEFFLYPHWKEVLTELKRNGFNPYLSTKYPLKEEDVKFLADIGIIDIQVSLDSAIEENLIPSLHINKGYVEQIANFITTLDKYDIKIMVHSVLTKYNQNVDDMESVYELIKDLKNIVHWHIVKADASLYSTTPFEEIEVSKDALTTISDFFKEISNTAKFPIQYPHEEEAKKNEKKHSEVDILKIKINNFFNRTFCSGLFSSLYILPDGKVTICEQLYWNQDFIVGDIKKQSLQEIWNSDKANFIFNIKQDDIPEDSACHSCEFFKSCREGRQVCYREVIRKFGKKKWYYPDPTCPFIDENGEKRVLANLLNEQR